MTGRDDVIPLVGVLLVLIGVIVVPAMARSVRGPGRAMAALAWLL
jgi:hypothetical protein